MLTFQKFYVYCFFRGRRSPEKRSCGNPVSAIFFIRVAAVKPVGLKVRPTGLSTVLTLHGTIVLPLTFSSALPASRRDELEELMFFHPEQGEHTTSINASIEAYGFPKVLQEDDCLRIGIAGLELRALVVGPGEPRLRRDRDGIGGKRDRAFLVLARPVAQQPVVGDVVGQLRHQPRPRLAVAFLQGLSLDFHSATRQVLDLKLRTSSQRLGCFLLSLVPDSARVPVSLRLPYQKRLLAARLGCRYENLSRAFAVLRDYGVETHGSRVILRDLEALREFSVPEPAAGSPLPLSSAAEAFSRAFQF